MNDASAHLTSARVMSLASCLRVDFRLLLLALPLRPRSRLGWRRLAHEWRVAAARQPVTSRGATDRLSAQWPATQHQSQVTKDSSDGPGERPTQSKLLQY
jgi:hypothetical protein